MTASENSQKRWNTLLKRLRHDFPDASHTPPASAATLPDLLVHGLLLWEASTHQAETGHQKLRATFTDHNELRVSMPDDIAQALGERYPLADERAMRLRAALNDIFAREHSVCLDRLRSMTKRDARQYLLTLDGCPEYAASYVVLHGLSGHAVPIDERLTAMLIKAGVAASGTSPATISSWIEHYVHAEESAGIHAVLRAWSDRDGNPPAREKKHPQDKAAPAAPTAAESAPPSSPAPPRAAKPAKGKTKASKGARNT